MIRGDASDLEPVTDPAPTDASGLDVPDAAPLASNAAQPLPARPKSLLARLDLRALARAALTSLDQALLKWTDATRSRVAMMALISVALAAACWQATHLELLPQLLQNKLTKPQRTEALIYLGASATAMVLLHVAATIVHRVRHSEWSPAPSALLNRWLSFVLAAPIVVALTTPKIETSNAFVTLAGIALAAVLCIPTLRAFGRAQEGAVAGDDDAAPWRRALQRAGRWLAPLTVVGMWAAYAWFFSSLSIANHHGMLTRVIDLGYYDNIFYQSIHGRPLACSFMKAGHHASAHFDPILVVLSPLYLIYPRAELLLVLQSVWCGAGVVPCYLLGRRLLSSRPAGLVLGAVYACYPALHGANMYEFHSLTLLATPLLFALYFFESGATKRYYAMLALLLLIREDVPLIMCFVGAYALLSRRPGYGRLGWITIVVSLAYFAIVKTYFMTSGDVFNSGKEAYSFEYYYRDMIPGGEGIVGLVVTLVTNPVFALKHAFSEAKLQYILVLLLPLMFLPLSARPGRVMLLYGATFLLLASRPPVFQPHFQYGVLAFPMAFSLVPSAIRRLEEGGLARQRGLSRVEIRAALLGSMLVACVLCSWKFGAIVENTSFRAGFSRAVRTPSQETQWNYGRVREIADRIEPGASVTVTDRVGAHVSNRKDVYLYAQRKHTDYVFVDEREIKKDMEAWHKRRVERRELVLIDSISSIKLYRYHDTNRPRGRDESLERAPKPEPPPPALKRPPTPAPTTDEPERPDPDEERGPG